MSTETTSRCTLARNVLYWTAVAIVFVVFALACYHRVGNYWQIGHNGFNGAAFSNGARNSLRFGEVGQAIFYTGVKQPSKQILYTHHPLMLHFHLIAMQAAFGASELAGRLIPATYNFLILVILFIAVRRLWGDAMALLSAAFYVVIPVNTIFANMINHEQAGIFWCLLLVYSYIRWIQTWRKRHFLLTLLAVTMAAQFDWPGYYISFFMAIHAFVHGLARGRILRWKPEYTWVIVFSLVVLANFGGFFLWIYLERGNLHDMWGVFKFRSGSPGNYYGHVFERSLDLQGIVFLVLLVEWLRLFLKRTLSWTVGIRDLIPSLFFVAQLIHSLVFKQAGYIHSYWIIWASVTLAVGGADVVLSFVGWLSRAIHQRRRAAASTPLPSGLLRAAVMLLVLVPLLGYQSYFAAKKFWWGVSTGHGSYVRPYFDGYIEAMSVKQLRSHYDREHLRWILHDTIRHRQIAFFWYLDAPREQRPRIVVRPRDRKAAKHVFYVVDVHRLQNENDLEKLHQLSNKHPTEVWNRRIVTVDVARSHPNPKKPRNRAWILKPRPRSILWSWFVNPRHPRGDWVPDPDPDVVKRMLSPVKDLSPEQLAGGNAGRWTRWNCLSGQALYALHGGTLDEKNKPPVMRWIVPYCRLLDPEGDLTEHLVTEGPYQGEEPPGRKKILTCRPGDAIVGLHGKKGACVDALGIICAGVEPPEEEGGKPRLTTMYKSRMVGSQDTGHRFEFVCPPGHVATSYRGRWLNKILLAGIACAPLEHVLDAAHRYGGGGG